MRAAPTSTPWSSRCLKRSIHNDFSFVSAEPDLWRSRREMAMLSPQKQCCLLRSDESNVNLSPAINLEFD